MPLSPRTVEPGVGVLDFSWFFCLWFWRGRAGFNPHHKGEIPERTRSQEMRGWKGVWHRGRVIWSRRTRALEWRNSRPECGSKFSSPSVFLIRTAPPVTSRQKVEQLLHQRPNLPFQFGAEGGALEIRENKLYPLHFLTDLTTPYSLLPGLTDVPAPHSMTWFLSPSWRPHSFSD